MATTLMRTTRAFTTVLFALAVSAIAGCAGENPAPTFTPRTLPPDATQHVPEEYEEPKPSPEPDAELVPPVIPPENREFDLDGAEATARYYLAAFEYGYASLDSGPLERISTKNCKTCAKHIQAIDEFKRENKSMDGGEITIGRLVEHHENDRKVVLTISANQEPLAIRDASNTVVSTDPGGIANMEFLLHYQSGMWSIEAVAADVQVHE